MVVGAQKDVHEDSRVEPIIKDLQMLRGLFMSALRKGTLEKEELKKNPEHFLQHDYHLNDMDFAKESVDMEGIHFLTTDVKSLIALSNAYATDRSDANLNAIIEVRSRLFAAVQTACVSQCHDSPGNILCTRPILPSFLALSCQAVTVEGREPSETVIHHETTSLSEDGGRSFRCTGKVTCASEPGPHDCAQLSLQQGNTVTAPFEQRPTAAFRTQKRNHGAGHASAVTVGCARRQSVHHERGSGVALLHMQ